MDLNLFIVLGICILLIVVMAAAMQVIKAVDTRRSNNARKDFNTRAKQIAALYEAIKDDDTKLSNPLYIEPLRKRIRDLFRSSPYRRHGYDWAVLLDSLYTAAKIRETIRRVAQSAQPSRHELKAALLLYKSSPASVTAPLTEEGLDIQQVIEGLRKEIWRYWDIQFEPDNPCYEELKRFFSRAEEFELYISGSDHYEAVSTFKSQLTEWEVCVRLELFKEEEVRGFMEKWDHLLTHHEKEPALAMFTGNRPDKPSDWPGKELLRYAWRVIDGMDPEQGITEAKFIVALCNTYPALDHQVAPAMGHLTRFIDHYERTKLKR